LRVEAVKRSHSINDPDNDDSSTTSTVKHKPILEISMDFIQPRRPTIRNTSSVRGASTPPSINQPHHDFSRSDTREDLEGYRLEQMELHLCTHMNRNFEDLSDRLDFRNREIGK